MLNTDPCSARASNRWNPTVGSDLRTEQAAAPWSRKGSWPQAAASNASACAKSHSFDCFQNAAMTSAHLAQSHLQRMHAMKLSRGQISNTQRVAPSAHYVQAPPPYRHRASDAGLGILSSPAW